MLPRPAAGRNEPFLGHCRAPTRYYAARPDEYGVPETADIIDITLTRARDNRIKDKDNKSFRRARNAYDGIDEPYLLEELLVRYSVEFTRTPVNERCVFCNATYVGEPKVKLPDNGYAVSNHVWLVDFYRANNVDFSKPVEGLLMIWSKKWRNAGLGDPNGAFVGLCAVRADRHRNIAAIEVNLEARL